MSTERDEKHKSIMPETLHSLSTLMLGLPGTGKTTALEHLAQRDMENGDGVAIVDPWGDLSERILDLVPEDCMDDVIYFELGNPDFCPLWNPLKNVQDINDICLKADAIVDVINADDRLNSKQDHLLRQCILGILHLDNPTLSDIPHCLSASSNAGKQFQKRVLEALKDERLRAFWKHKINEYRPSDFAPILSRFTKFLLDETAGLMFSQPEQRFDFKKILGENKIFIANLSSIGVGARAVIGNFITRFFYAAACGRDHVPYEQRKPFYLYADDASFLHGGIHDLFAEGRRLRVSLTLAFRTLDQMKEPLASDALAYAGSTIVFKVRQTDATRIGKLLGAQPQELVSLKTGDTITRTENGVRHIRFPPPHMAPDTSQRDRLIQMSRQRYCRPAEEVRASITGRTRAVRYKSLT
jgi:hypothetical protein